MQWHLTRHVRTFFSPPMNGSGAELTLGLAGGLEGWADLRSEVVTNAGCALFLMSRAPPAARERLKEGGKVTQFLANLSKRGSEVQKKVGGNLRILRPSLRSSSGVKLPPQSRGTWRWKHAPSGCLPRFFVRSEYTTWYICSNLRRVNAFR